MADANLELFDGTNRGLLLDVSVAGAARGHQASSLIDQLRDSIRSRSLPAQTRLPATRTLARDLGVSRGVVVRAYEQLTAEGYLIAHQGSGTAVASVPAPGDPKRPAPRRPASNPGLPAGDLFPRAGWLRSLTEALSDLPDVDLSYGDPAGLPTLRHELGAYLGRVRGLLAHPERIVVVNGFAQACRILADVLLNEGTKRIGVEDPGSVGLREQLTQAGMTCVPVTVDHDGLSVADLAATDLQAVIVTPAHQFPTGVVMSGERRHALLSWARRTGGLVIEDDYDAELRYDRTPVGALQGLGPDVVIHGGSVSKTLAPGLRLGWMVLPDDRVGAVRDAKYAIDLATPVLEQAAFAHFLANGQMDRHLRRMASHCRARRDSLVRALATHVPGWTVTGTAAGLHLVVHPPPVHPEPDIATMAQRCGLDARPLGDYRVGKPGPAGLVIGYGHQRPDRLTRAIIDLAHELDA